jgi:Glycosyl hydrolases family 18
MKKVRCPRQVSTPMKLNIIASITAICSVLWAGNALAYDCSGLPQWKRQSYYLLGAKVQYLNTAYENTAESSKRASPDSGDPWISLGSCDGTGGGGGGGSVPPQPLSIYGVWHCGNSFCAWSQVRDMAEFDRANHWIIDRNNGGDHHPSVNLVVLSFLKPMELLLGTTNNAFENGIPVGMTPEIVNYFKAHDIRVLLSMGGVTYTDSWNQALASDPALLARNAIAAIELLHADGLEIDWENGTPTAVQMAGMETFIATYNQQTEAVLSLDLAVGNRYLQELSRRAAADWLPNGHVDYVNAMVPRGEPDTAQWQEHVDGKTNYDPPILPKAPAKVVVSMWLTNSRSPHANCVDFGASTQLAKADYVQTIQPNGAGQTPGFLGYMFWAAECPSTRSVCTTPPNSCEGGMGVGASRFGIQPLDFSTLRQN